MHSEATVSGKETRSLVIRGLCGYYGDTRVLHGVDIDVRSGELVCLLGRNGAGKTTTLRAIVGLLRKRSGTVEIHQCPTESLRPEKICRLGVGYRPEERGIFASLTVEENLLLLPVLMAGEFNVEDLSIVSKSVCTTKNSGHKVVWRIATDVSDCTYPSHRCETGAA